MTALRTKRTLTCERITVRSAGRSSRSLHGQWHHAVLTAQLGHRRTAFSLLQYRDDLFIGAYAAPSGATVPSSSVYLLVFIRNLLKPFSPHHTGSLPSYLGMESMLSIHSSADRRQVCICGTS